jgi:hypothetical protein
LSCSHFPWLAGDSWESSSKLAVSKSVRRPRDLLVSAWFF